MSTSGLSYKELSIPYFKEAFDTIDEVMVLHGVHYYLIGVTAVDLKLLEQGFTPSRGTKDIDFAVMVSTLGEYQSIIDSLTERGFNKVKAPWTVYHPTYNLVVDILPFGQIEQQDTVQFNERYTDLHVLGFKEVLSEPVESIIEEKIVRMPSFPGMVVLKLVSWNDRPEERDNDLYDILRIIDKYFEFNFDEIVEHHYDTFPDGDLDRLIVAARVLGRNARRFLKNSVNLESRVLLVLKNNLMDAENSTIARKWAVIRQCEINYAHSILSAFHVGITE
jgi:predicted nucleotidyltransferase